MSWRWQSPWLPRAGRQSLRSAPCAQNQAHGPARGGGWGGGRGGVVTAGTLIAWVVCLRAFPLVVVCSARCARCAQGCWCAAPSLACGPRRLRRSGGVRWGGACERSVGPGSGARPGGCGAQVQEVGRSSPGLGPSVPRTCTALARESPPPPPRAGAAKVEACAGRQPGAWALRAAAAALWTGRGRGRRERGPAGHGVWPGLRGGRAGQRTRRRPVGPGAGWSAAKGQAAGGVGNGAPPGVRGAAAKRTGGKSLQHPVFPGGLPSKY